MRYYKVMAENKNNKDFIKLGIASMHALAAIGQYLNKRQQEKETFVDKAKHTKDKTRDRAAKAFDLFEEKAYEAEGHLPSRLQRKSRQQQTRHKQAGIVATMMLALASIGGLVAYLVKQRPNTMPSPLAKAKEVAQEKNIIAASAAAIEQTAKDVEAGAKVKADDAAAGLEAMKTAATAAATTALDQKVIQPLKQKAIKIGVIAFIALTLYIFALAFLAALLANSL